MKMGSTIGLITIILTLMLTVSIPAEEQGETISLVSEQLTSISQGADLDDTPMTKVKELLLKSEEQAKRDRESFKNNPLELIDAARQRRKITAEKITLLLKEKQKKEFSELWQMDLQEQELFVLTEGLLLDNDQAFTVEGILIEHYNKIKDRMPPGMFDRMGRGGGGGKGGIRGGGGMRGGGMRGGGMGYMRGMGGMNGKKVSAIKKILTKVQKAHYKIIRKDMKKKFKELRKQYKERMKK